MKILKFNMLKVVVVLGRVGVVVSKNHRWMSTIALASLLLYNIVSGCMYLFYNMVGIKALAKTLVPVSFGIMGLTCLILSVIHRKNYIKLINEAMWEFEIEFPVATKETKKNLFLVNLYVFGFAFFEFVVFALYSVEPYFQDTLILPFPILFPFKTDTVVLYTFAYIFEMSFSFLGGTVLLVTTLFFCNLMEQTCMRYDNLANQIREKLQKVENIFSPQKEIDENLLRSLQEFLKESVQTHINLRSRIRVIDQTFSTFFLLGLIGYVPTVSGSILEFVSYGTEETVIYYMKFGTVMIGGLFMVFIPCHCGSRIVDAQLRIPDAIYRYKWTRYPESIQKTLNILFTVGRVPVCVTGGGIVTIDLVGYCQVTGLVYSIFTLLNHFKSNSNTSPF